MDGVHTALFGLSVLSLAVMPEAHVLHLPAIDGAKLAGVISMHDVIQARLAGKDQQLQQLLNGMEGRGYRADPLQKHRLLKNSFPVMARPNRWGSCGGACL